MATTPRSTTLDQQINDYLLTASGHLKENSTPIHGKHAIAFGAAASSALVMMSQAEAAVVFNGSPSISVVNGVGSGTFNGAGYRLFDMDGDNNDDFAIWGYPDGNNGVAVAFSGTNAMFGGGSDDLPKLSAGFSIGPAIPGGSWTGSSSAMDTSNDIVFDGIGNPAGSGWLGNVNERGLIGVRFGNAGGTHYGWICLQSNPTSGNASVSVTAYAYESDPDTAIQAGATGSGTYSCNTNGTVPASPIPVMGAAGYGLSTLALGALGLANLRRRREKQAGGETRQ